MADDKKIIFSMVGVSKAFQANKQVLKDIYLSFFYGAKIGIIGLNGSGKSTLLKIIAGLEKSYQGEVVFSPGYSVGYLAQEPHLDNDKTVKEVVMEGVQNVVDTLAEYEEINNKFGLPEYYEDPEKMDALFARQAELQDIIDSTDAWNLDSKLERAMDALRCPPEDQLVKNLSGGERRRVALCRLLLQKPDILLLDEPTNHLDAESIDWLEQHLQQYEGTVICITHDRYFLDHVAGWILELDRGEGIPWKGNYSSWLEQKTKRMEMEEKTASKRRKTLERELEWVRMAPKARQAKGKARLNSYDKLLNDYGIQLEMASVNYCIAMTSVGDKQVYYDRFIEALRQLDTPENEYSGSYSPALVKAVVALNMYEADSCDNETVNICDSIGHIAASNICFYPPGINLVNAGEVVTQEVIDVIKDGLGHGLSAIGVEKAADGSTLIKCVKQRTVL